MAALRPSSDACRVFDPGHLSAADFYGHMVQAVVPRPIALVSSCDAEGRVNLSPFSFFNIVGVKPPTLVFSPTRSATDGTNKHTLDNVYAHPEVAIHIVSHEMVEQTALSSANYAKGVDECLKAGFQTLASERVRPPRLAVAPIVFECKVSKVLQLGSGGGSGNLVICEVLLMHVKEEVMDQNGDISVPLFDPVARLGKDDYCRVSRSSLFKVQKPTNALGVGADAYPLAVRNSPVLTGNELGKLAALNALPSEAEVTAFATSPTGKRLKKAIEGAKTSSQAQRLQHREAQALLKADRSKEACLALLSTYQLHKTGKK